MLQVCDSLIPRLVKVLYQYILSKSALPFSVSKHGLLTEVYRPQ